MRVLGIGAIVLGCVAAVCGSPVPVDRPEVLSAIYVGGTVGEIGELVGRRFSEAISRRLSSSNYEHLQAFVQSGSGREAFERMWSAVRSNSDFSWMLAEVAGVAAGANISMEQALVLNMGDELERLSGAAMVPHCSDVLSGSLSSICHNEDGATDTLNLTYVVQATPEAPHPQYTVYSYPGQLATGAFGWNQHGVWMSLNGLFPTHVDIDGIPRHFAHRYLLEATSLDDAVARAKRLRVACGFSVNFAQAGVPHRVINIEVAANTPPSVLSFTAADHAGFHANQYLRLNVSQSPDPSSDHRLARFKQFPNPNSTADLHDILGDTKDPLYPIWRSGVPPDDLATYATATFRACDPNCESATVEIQLKNPKNDAFPLFRQTIVPKNT